MNACDVTRTFFIYFNVDILIWQYKTHAPKATMGVGTGSTPFKEHSNHSLRKHYSLNETHLVVVRGLIHQEVSTKVRQRGELNWAS